MSELRIGTCSWKYDSWKGILYPDRAGINYLEEYAAHYDTVEIDQWFWSLHGEERVSLPRPAVVKEYVESVPHEFKFSVKIPNSITLTHFYRKTKKEPLRDNPHFLSLELLTRFLDLVSPMGNRLGPLMFQFEYLNKQKMASQAEFMERFGEFIRNCPRGYTYCIETRNPNYLNESYFRFLRQHGLHHVFIQGYYMPSIFETYEACGDHIRDLTVIRLHGPNRKEIEAKSAGRWNRIVEPKDSELDQLKAMLEDLRSRDFTAYLNVNNHYEGSAPLTIRRIQRTIR